MWSLAVVDMKLIGIVKSSFRYEIQIGRSTHFWGILIRIELLLFTGNIRCSNILNSLILNSYWSTFCMDCCMIEFHATIDFSNTILFYVSTCVWINVFCLFDFLNIRRCKKFSMCIFWVGFSLQSHYVYDYILELSFSLFWGQKK